MTLRAHHRPSLLYASLIETDTEANFQLIWSRRTAV
ncbi:MULTISPECIES: DUF736 domain-containing protein [unclassified Mesorhizobium]|nr:MULTISPECIES: DUF736 domain-containing protein [unclassified Mesorhizobium]TPN50178.1 DUF736 domain-containing protein [Mesorhizobium sp. B1-1-9]TPN53272.1 DUF736 domain-containing protein [Mesorhizobium sp. B1-1-7]